MRRVVAGTAALTLALLLLLVTRTSASAASPIWVGDYNTGDLSQFQATPWNDVPAAPGVVSSPTFEGGYAGKYVIPAGGARSENVPNLREFTEGDDLWFGWSTQLGPDFPLNVPNWQVVTQWKNDGTGSPPLELTVESGQYRFEGGYGRTNSTAYMWSASLGAASAGVWDRWTVHVVFSSNPAVGTVDLWRNGVQLLTGYHPKGGTLYPGLNDYLKVGYYRDSAITTQGTVYQDGWAVGTTRDSVDPAAPAPSPSPVTVTQTVTAPAPSPSLTPVCVLTYQ